jgi:hypothetical protein
MHSTCQRLPLESADGGVNGEEIMRVRHLICVVAAGLGSAACSVNPMEPTAGSLSVPAVRAISIDPQMLVRTEPAEAIIARNPAPTPPAAADVAPPAKPVVAPPRPPAHAGAPKPPVAPPPPPPAAAVTPAPAGPAPVDGPCGAIPCAPPVTAACPAGTVPTLRDVVTCEAPPPPTTCPPGTHPVLRDTLTCEK